ncbi:DUF2950 family protein [Pseudoroseomonas globiformis]|uniref:DUF2950 family protein n=1 Tax=Teichococcus globiformis TaxID=2307229 RepID=A0ABV7G842_9PROT
MIRRLFLLSIALLLAAEPARADAPDLPHGFRSAEAGFIALAAAVRQNDLHALRRMLGDEGVGLIRASDPTESRTARQRFTAAYSARHEIVLLPPGRAELLIGEDRFPFAIPMVRLGGSWRFDVPAGADALAVQRIGRNELDTIETLRLIVAAQIEYAAGPGRAGGMVAYADRFFSRPGRHDGLYWPSRPGQADSPLGPFLAAAGMTDAPERDDRPIPFNGYVYRILTAQGPVAPGGALDYRIGGRLIGGFAVLAIPVEYGESGIKSFLVNHNGIVWEQDLGSDTAQVAAAILRYNPGPGWSRVAD